MQDFDPQPNDEDKTRLQEGDYSIEVSIGDAKLIKKSIEEYLEKSDIGDRAYLLSHMAKTPQWIDSDGKLTISGWRMYLQDKQILARFNLNSNQERSVGYLATFSRKFKVVKIVPHKIIYRRSKSN